MSNTRGQDSANESSTGNSESNFISLTPQAALFHYYSNLRDETFLIERRHLPDLSDLSNQTRPYLDDRSYGTSNHISEPSSMLQQWSAIPVAHPFQDPVGRHQVTYRHFDGGLGVADTPVLLALMQHYQSMHGVPQVDIPTQDLSTLGEQLGNVSSGPPQGSIIELLEKRNYECVTCDSHSDPETCSICIDEYVLEDELGVLNCGHEFHVDCIKKWLLIKNECPICRAKGLGV